MSGPIAPTSAHDRHARAIPWRRCQALGGFALACSFFMPVVDGCNSPIYPVTFTIDVVTGIGQEPIDDILFASLMAVPAYLFGAFVFVGHVKRRDSRSTEQQVRGWVWWLLACCTAVMLLGLAINILANNSPPFLDFAPDVAIAFGLSLITSWYLWQSKGPGLASRLSVRWYGAVCSVLWFLWLGLNPGSPRWGLYVSLVGSLVILAGTTAEAIVMGRLSPFRSLIGLTTASYQAADPDIPGCRRCGYLLYGLREPRCPECGTPFTPAASDTMSLPNTDARSASASLSKQNARTRSASTN